MSRRLAHRPHHHLARITPRTFPQSQRAYLRQRWIYHQQRIPYPKRPLGYGLALIPFGWRLALPELRRRA